MDMGEESQEGNTSRKTEKLKKIRKFQFNIFEVEKFHPIIHHTCQSYEEMFSDFINGLAPFIVRRVKVFNKSWNKIRLSPKSGLNINTL